MLLSVTEAAQLLGVSARTVRTRLARGELKGRKRGGQWVVPRDVLPLPESEHRRLQQTADAIRRTVDAALPSRATGARTRRSVVDEIAFRAAHALRQSLRASAHPAASPAADAVEDGLIHLGAALHQWGPETRLTALREARAAMSRATVLLLLDAPMPPEDPVRGWVVALEHEVLPPIAGLFRRAERSRGERRP